MARNKIEQILNKELSRPVIKVEQITNEIMDYLGQRFQTAYAQAATGKKDTETILKELYEKIREGWKYK